MSVPSLATVNGSETTVSAADVTVIMPAYRAAATIGRALMSIAHQTAAPGRVIVVDDGSDDDTAEVVKRQSDVVGGVEITLLCQSNQGPGAARNRALAEVQTELVAFLDSDDEWLPDKLARVLFAFDDPATVLVCHDMIVVDGDRERRTNGVRHSEREAEVYVALYKRGFIATSTVVCRTSVAREVGGFDASLPAGQDYEMWLRIARDHGSGIVVIEEPLTRYHVLSGSITSNVSRRRHCALRIAARHEPELRDRKCSRLAVIATRAAIISLEAAIGHRRNGNWLAPIVVLAQFPAALFEILRGERCIGHVTRTVRLQR